MAGLEPVQDVYDNERGDQGDRAESDDELSDEDESDEEEAIAHSVPFKCIGAAHEKKLLTSFGKLRHDISLFMNKIKQ